MSDIKKGSCIQKEKLISLEPEFKIKALKVIKKLEEKGYIMRIVWGRRTIEENDILVKKNLASPNSKHLAGKAIDIVLRRHGYTKNDSNKQFWKDLEIEVKKEGLIWGGDWETPNDPGHFEAKH